MVMLVTENELLSAAINSEGRLTFTRENGDIIDAGIAVGPAVTDADMATIAADAGSSFAGQLSATTVQIRNRPVNLAERLPAGHAASDPVDSILRTAIAESPVVEIPEGVTLTFTDAAGITIPAGSSVRAGQGAKALVNHAGAGFKVSGALSGIEVEYTGGSTLADVGVHVLPTTDRVNVVGVKVTGGVACFAIGGNETTGGGDAVDAFLEGCVGSTDVTSSYVYRVDESVGVELAHCVGLGSTLDSIKLRRRARRFRVNGGRYTGAVGGDGLDGFAGADEAFIGGGVIFHDNGQNGFVFKTDDMPPLTPAEQAAQFGVPKRIIIDGVISTGNGGNGAALHRSNDTDSEVGAGAEIPWMRQVLVSGLLSTENDAQGLFLNMRGAHLSGVIAANNGSNGINVHANARDISMTGVQAYANGTITPGGFDDFYLAGQRLFLAQCMAFGVDPDAVDEADLLAATKVSRYGFRIPTGALVRMVQTNAAYHATAPISDSDGMTTMIDCDLRDGAGVVYANTSGHIMRSTEALAFRDGVSFRQAVRLVATGANPGMMIGDNSATGLSQLILAAKSTGSILATAKLIPQAHNVYDLGTHTQRWRDIAAQRYVMVGALWLRGDSGVLEQSTDLGVTWSAV